MRFAYIVPIPLCIWAVTACGGDSFVASTGDNLGGGSGGAPPGGSGGGSDGGSGGLSGRGASGGSAGNPTGGTGLAGDGGAGASVGTGGSRGGTGGTTGGSGGTAGMTGGTGGSNPTGGTGGSSTTGGSGGSTSSTAQYAHNYDQTCTYDVDCTLVTEGDACGCTGCENAAVADEAFEKYMVDWNAIDCPTSGEPIVCAAGCAQVLPACSDGKCVARQPVYVQASQFDRACFEDSDCHLIFEGEVCSSCQCGGAAVNSGGFAQYQAILEEASCNPGPSLCDCPVAGDPRCLRDSDASLGECVVGL